MAEEKKSLAKDNKSFIANWLDNKPVPSDYYKYIKVWEKEIIQLAVNNRFDNIKCVLVNSGHFKPSHASALAVALCTHYGSSSHRIGNARRYGLAQRVEIRQRPQSQSQSRSSGYGSSHTQSILPLSEIQRIMRVGWKNFDILKDDDALEKLLDEEYESSLLFSKSLDLRFLHHQTKVTKQRKLKKKKNLPTKLEMISEEPETIQPVDQTCCVCL